MTALHQYSRLEAAGLWRSAPDAQGREVVVGLRKATLVLIDPKTELPLTQWSLPAIERIGTFENFVTFASHEDGVETLEIDDRDMIAALDTVRAALDLRCKRPGRLRFVLLAGASALLVVGLAVWLPLGLNGFTASRLPDAARKGISAMVMADIVKISGSPCTGSMGLAASSELAQRVFVDAPPALAVLREGLRFPASLPDGTILLPYPLVERADGPDTLAGIILAQRVIADREDPLVSALRHAGVFATLRLLSSGTLPAGALDGFGLALAATPPLLPDAAALRVAFETAKISTAPYSIFAAHSALATLPDPMPKGSAPQVLDDAAFLGLQYICDQ